MLRPCLLLGTLALAMLPLAAPQPARSAGESIYTVLHLGALRDGESRAYDVNDTGQVVGESARRPFLWQNGAFTELGLPAGADSAVARSINNARQIAGHFYDADDHLRAVIWGPGGPNDLGTLGGADAEALSINDAGHVVGHSTTASGETHAFLYSGSGLRDLGTLGGRNSYAWDVNDSDQVVGFSESPSGTRAFVWQNGVMRDLGIAGQAQARAVNNNGQIAGFYFSDTGEQVAFLWQNGSISNSGFGLGSALPTDINDAGQVVGEYFNPSAGMRPFLWTNGAAVDLNTLLPEDSGWVLLDAWGINNRGQIAGSGVYREGNQNPVRRAFLLNPAGPDLTGTWQSLGQRFTGRGRRRRAQLRGELRVSNSGADAAGATVLEIYLSDDAAVDSTDRRVRRVRVGALGAGRERTVRLRTTLPRGVNASGKFVIAVVDAGASVDETDESNNTVVFGPVP